MNILKQCHHTPFPISTPIASPARGLGRERSRPQALSETRLQSGDSLDRRPAPSLLDSHERRVVDVGLLLDCAQAEARRRVSECQNEQSNCFCGCVARDGLMGPIRGVSHGVVPLSRGHISTIRPTTPDVSWQGDPLPSAMDIGTTEVHADINQHSAGLAARWPVRGACRLAASEVMR